MLSGYGQFGLFLAKALIIFFLILFFVILLLVVVSKTRDKLKGRFLIQNLNEKLDEIKENLLSETMSKDEFKQFLKEKKKRLKEEKKNPPKKPKVFVLQFHGDVQASAVNSLREEVSAILTVATPQDEVVVKVESGGGMVHAYGLAASQLKRIRDKHIPLTVTVDKIAASGGYLMAAVADRILAAPFAIIGSIGVVFQMPNFNRVLNENHVEYEQITAGNFKRTLTLFGKNTEEGREKLREELEEIHQQFQSLIKEFRPDLDLKRVATGEHWLAKQALELKLVDSLITSDGYLVNRSENAVVYEITFEMKKSWSERLRAGIQHWMESSKHHANFIL